jgi:hypothetical protein
LHRTGVVAAGGVTLQRLSVGLDDVDALLLEVGVQLLELLLGDLDFFKSRFDLPESQEPSLLSLGDQRPQLVKLRDRSLVRQQDCLFAHSP